MKKLLALFISLLLMLNLVACGAPAEPEVWYSEDGITITQEKTQQILNNIIHLFYKYFLITCHISEIIQW